MTDEDEEFARIERENAMKGQPYHFIKRKDEDDDIQEYVRPWKGLTDSEMLECLKAVDVATAVNLLMSQYEMPPTFKVYAEAIQAKLKEKNHG